MLIAGIKKKRGVTPLFRDRVSKNPLFARFLQKQSRFKRTEKAASQSAKQEQGLSTQTLYH